MHPASLMFFVSERRKATEPEDLGHFFMERGNAGDLDGLVELYEPTALLVFPPGRVTSGRSTRLAQRRPCAHLNSLLRRGNGGSCAPSARRQLAMDSRSTKRAQVIQAKIVSNCLQQSRDGTLIAAVECLTLELHRPLMSRNASAPSSRPLPCC